MKRFINQDPSIDDYWRSIILFGRNVASYKFALALSLIDLAKMGKNRIALPELADPFSKHIVSHLETGRKQGVFQSSKFLTACEDYISGSLNHDDLIENTSKLGFVNVIDAFHIVNRGEIPVRFFVDERKESNSIRITDNLFKLMESFQSNNLPFEGEARWKLVETAWSLKISPNLLVVKFDSVNQDLYLEDKAFRQNVTSSRDALNGYQKGRCFYCFREISLDDVKGFPIEVDHFFPNVLKKVINSERINIDGVWNLVLSCVDCNRGGDGKFARIPGAKFRERLHTRNNFLINSHHPLRETLINQTGKTEKDRSDFLKYLDSIAIKHLIHRWNPQEELPGTF
ncbi:MAG: hypothetical protein JEZ06_24395 [Anaerolineaceae bacterium]|nr:hypothetical protein [Anaerolineaceae bacterium]